MNFQKLYRKIQSLDQPKTALKESVDMDSIKMLTSKLESGEIDYAEFRDQLDSLEHTDYSMRQGEMGEPDRREQSAWDREKSDWDFDDQSDDEYDDDSEFKEELHSDSEMEECGMMNMASPTSAKQTDNVTMNVNMSGTGSGGIRDLMNVLKDIQDGPDADPGPALLIQKQHDSFEEVDDLSNSPNEKYYSLNSVVNPPSNGLNNPGRAYPKAAGGDNPMNLKPRLESLYQEIKFRK